MITFETAKKVVRETFIEEYHMYWKGLLGMGTFEIMLGSPPWDRTSCEMKKQVFMS